MINRALRATRALSTAMALVLASGVLASGAAQAQAAGGEPVKIGAILSITGPIAPVSISQRDGMLLAAKVLNERGGINGRPIEIVLEDDASNPDAAIPKFNKLIHDDKVVALIGPNGIAQTAGIGAIAHSIKLPVVAFTGLGLDVEKERTCVFHLTPAQALNASSVLSYARHIGAKNIGVLHDTGFGQVIWNVMKDMGAEYGVTFTRVERFEAAATDATAQAAVIRASSPDAVIVLSASPVPFRGLHQVRIGVPVISIHGTASYQTVAAMGDAADNIVHAEFLIAEDPLENQKEFVELYEQEYGRKPKHMDAVGWDAMNILAKALAEAGDTDRDALCATIRQPYEGVMATWDFSQPDLGGLTLGSINYSILENGTFRRLDYKAGQ